MNILDKIKGKPKTVNQLNEELLRKGLIVKEGLNSEFWQIMKDFIFWQIEISRDELERPTQSKESSYLFGLFAKSVVNGANVKNDEHWSQFIRGSISTLRLLLKEPAKLVGKYEYLKEQQGKNKNKDKTKKK